MLLSSPVTFRARTWNKHTAGCTDDATGGYRENVRWKQCSVFKYTCANFAWKWPQPTLLLYSGCVGFSSRRLTVACALLVGSCGRTGVPREVEAEMGEFYGHNLQVLIIRTDTDGRTARKSGKRTQRRRLRRDWNKLSSLMREGILNFIYLCLGNWCWYVRNGCEPFFEWRTLVAAIVLEIFGVGVVWVICGFVWLKAY